MFGGWIARASIVGGDTARGPIAGEFGFVAAASIAVRSVPMTAADMVREPVFRDEVIGWDMV